MIGKIIQLNLNISYPNSKTQIISIMMQNVEIKATMHVFCTQRWAKNYLRICESFYVLLTVSVIVYYSLSARSSYSIYIVDSVSPEVSFLLGVTSLNDYSVSPKLSFFLGVTSLNEPFSSFLALTSFKPKQRISATVYTIPPQM